MLTRSAGRVAQEGYDGLKAGRRLVVPGFPNRVGAQLLPLLPRSLVLRMADARNRGRS
jgi:short-subunit dehydrogenase